MQCGISIEQHISQCWDEVVEQIYQAGFIAGVKQGHEIYGH